MNHVVRVSVVFAAVSTCAWGQSGVMNYSVNPGTSPGTLLSGSVLMDDGSSVSAGVAIQVACNGSELTVAHTSTSDDFDFRWTYPSSAGSPAGADNMMNSMTSVNRDASAANHLNILNAPQSCDVRASLPGYTSTEVSLNMPSAFDGSSVGVIWLHRIGTHHGNTVSVLSLEAPKAARKVFEKGVSQVRAKKFSDAVANLQKAVSIDPEYAEAWLNLGRAQWGMGSADEARSSLQRAMELDPKVVGTWQVLGYIAADQENWKDATYYLDRAVQLDPENSPTPWFYSALGHFHLHEYALAERNARAEINLDPQFRNRRAQYLLGLILVARQQWDRGADVLQSYLSSSPDPRDVATAHSVLVQARSYAAR